MPEVPEHIQENLAQLELEASGPRAGSAQRTAAEPQRQSQNGALHDAGTHPPRLSSLISAAPPQARSMQNPHGYPSVAGASEEPSFSPFPKLVNPPPNVPPSDEEKEAILENARTPVLNSNDPEMQLAWAQDALAYVDVAAGQQQRLAESRPGRPVTPQIEHSLRVDAVNIVVFLADQHHPKGEFMRGMWLEMGKFGFRLDKKEAFRCYSRAADKGYARAEYRIGMLYEQSNDPVKALMHYKRGAEAGDSPSNYVSVDQV